MKRNELDACNPVHVRHIKCGLQNHTRSVTLSHEEAVVCLGRRFEKRPHLDRWTNAGLSRWPHQTSGLSLRLGRRRSVGPHLVRLRRLGLTTAPPDGPLSGQYSYWQDWRIGTGERVTCQ
ncbi:hypothetical protein MRX96_015183 [Rhipicephalus microplus]